MSTCIRCIAARCSSTCLRNSFGMYLSSSFSTSSATVVSMDRSICALTWPGSNANITNTSSRHCLLSLSRCFNTSLFNASSNNPAGRTQTRIFHLMLHLLLICSCSSDWVDVKESRSDRILLNHIELYSITQLRRSYPSIFLSISPFPVKGEETIFNRDSSLVYVRTCQKCTRKDLGQGTHVDREGRCCC